MDTKFIIADACDVLAGAFLSVIDVSEVLDWIYTGLLIASILLGIFLKVYTAVKDKRVTAEEAKEIQDEIKAGMRAIEEQSEKIAKSKTAEEGEEGEINNGDE